MSHMRCLFCKVSYIYLKEQKEWTLFYLHQNAQWPKELRENSLHVNSGINILPNIINCCFLKSFGLMRCFIEKFITPHTSPYKYFQPSLLNKNTKVSQGAQSHSQIRPNKLKTTFWASSGRQETWIPYNYFKTNTVGYIPIPVT